MAIYKDVASLEVVGYTEPKNGTFSDGVQFILEKLDAIPEADVEPVRHGRWIDKTEDTRREYVCSECGRSVFLHFSHAIKEEPALLKVMYPYCNCGAKMNGKEKEK